MVGSTFVCKRNKCQKTVRHQRRTFVSLSVEAAVWFNNLIDCVDMNKKSKGSLKEDKKASHLIRLHLLDFYYVTCEFDREREGSEEKTERWRWGRGRGGGCDCESVCVCACVWTRYTAACTRTCASLTSDCKSDGQRKSSWQLV